MKRSELNVGDELYYADRYTWAHDHLGARVTVVAIEPYVINSWDHQIVKGPGSGVLVDVHHDQRPQTQTVVQLHNLRGPYREIMAEVETRRTVAREQVDGRLAARAEREARSAEVAEHACRLGLDAEQYNNLYAASNAPAKVLIAADALEGLLQMAEDIRAGVTVDLSRVIGTIDA
jgi:hypothetical protein